MTSFYIGLFSWFPLHFFAHSFKQIFSPPLKVETLDEKACLSHFIEQVLLRVLKGLRLSVGDIVKFYEIWDENRVVMRGVDKGYKYGNG